MNMKFIISLHPASLLVLLSQCWGLLSLKDFDFLLFAQQWPSSSCLLWKERSHENTCNFQANERWSVHGIWPTTNNKIGPLYCNHSVHFDPKSIESILPELRERWINVRKDGHPNSFWKHEYEKHGTCASALEPLKTELQYFKQGLAWNKLYDIYDYLNRVKIYPGKYYYANEILDAVQLGLNGSVLPSLECVPDTKDKNDLLAQINLCFDKNLSIINCTRVHGGTYINCPKKGQQKVFYPGDQRRKGPSVITITGITLAVGLLFACIAYFVHFFGKHYYRQRNRRAYENL